MEIILNDQTYSVGKLDALKQFHIMRRLAPILATVGMSLTELKRMDSNVGEGMESFMPLLGPISDVLGKMSDEDTNYILFSCLSVVKRQAPTGGFSPVTTGNNQLMYQDIDMVVMIRLAVEVVRENLRGFFSGLGEGTNLPSS